MKMEMKQQKALNRATRRALRKAQLPDELVARCYVWDCLGEVRLGNFALYTGKCTEKDVRKLRAILPHVQKTLQRAKVASGYKGNIHLCNTLAGVLEMDGNVPLL